MHHAGRPGRSLGAVLCVVLPVLMACSGPEDRAVALLEERADALTAALGELDLNLTGRRVFAATVGSTGDTAETDARVLELDVVPRTSVDGIVLISATAPSDGFLSDDASVYRCFRAVAGPAGHALDEIDCPVTAATIGDVAGREV